MAPIPGSVVVTGFIAPSDSADTYACYSEVYNLGGFRAVADAAGRTGITADRRKEGMMVYQVDTDEYWTLIGGIADINWVDLGPWGSASGLDPDPDVWVTNRIETIELAQATFLFPAGAGAYDNGKLYCNYRAGTVMTTVPPYYLLDISTPAAAIPRLFFGSEMNTVKMNWIAEGFGVQLNGAMTYANFGAAQFVIGWKDFGVVTEDASDYIVLMKKPGDYKLYASVSTAGTGGHHFTVDTGLLWVQDEVHKYEIMIDPVLFTADFYQDDVLIAHIDGDDVAWPDGALRPWAFEGVGDMAITTMPILYQFPWFVSMHK